MPSIYSCRSCSFSMPFSILALPRAVPPGSVEKSVVKEAPAARVAAARQIASPMHFRRWTGDDCFAAGLRPDWIRSGSRRCGKFKDERRNALSIRQLVFGGCMLVELNEAPGGTARLERNLERQLRQNGQANPCGLVELPKVVNSLPHTS